MAISGGKNQPSSDSDTNEKQTRLSCSIPWRPQFPTPHATETYDTHSRASWCAGENKASRRRDHTYDLDTDKVSLCKPLRESRAAGLTPLRCSTQQRFLSRPVARRGLGHPWDITCGTDPAAQHLSRCSAKRNRDGQSRVLVSAIVRCDKPFLASARIFVCHTKTALHREKKKRGKGGADINIYIRILMYVCGRMYICMHTV